MRWGGSLWANPIHPSAEPQSSPRMHAPRGPWMRAPKGPKNARTHGAEGCRRGVREPGLEFRTGGLPEQCLALDFGGFYTVCSEGKGLGSHPQGGRGTWARCACSSRAPRWVQAPGGGIAPGAGGLPVPLGLCSALLQTPPTKQVTKPALVPALGPAWQPPPRSGQALAAAPGFYIPAAASKTAQEASRMGRGREPELAGGFMGSQRERLGGPHWHPDPTAPRGAPQLGSVPGVLSILGGSLAEPEVLGREMSRGEQTDKPQTLR